MADITETAEFRDFVAQLTKAKGWYVVRNVDPFFMQLLVFDDFCKAQFTPYKNVYQVRLTAKGRDYVA